MDSLWAKPESRGASKSGERFARFSLLLAVGCLLLVGCNQGRQLQSDLYQRELRLQEDEIYRLEDYVEEYQEIIKGYRCELAEVRKQLAEKRPSERSGQSTEALPAPTRVVPETPESLDLETIDDTQENAPGDVLPDIDVPDLPTGPAEPLPESLDGIEEAPPFELEPPTDAAPLFETPQADMPSSAVPRPTTIQPASATSQSAVVGDVNTPPHPYPHAAVEKPIEPPMGVDPSIAIRVELDEANQTLTAIVSEVTRDTLSQFAGVASLMLTDPSIEGGQRRIARWDYTQEEVRSAQQGRDRDRFKFAIALPEQTPPNRELRVWIRLIDRTGRKRMQATSLTLGGNGELVTATRPRKLPPGGEFLSTPSEPANFALDEIRTARPIEQWRPAQSAERPRTIDPALVPATFDAE